jgi:Trypsin
VLKLEAAISAKVLSWAAADVHLGYLKPTRNGYLEIGVRSHATAGARSEVAAAASRLDAAYGRSWIHVVRDSRPSTFLSFRYNDTAPWNGGDFIYNNSGSSGEDCTSGIPVHSIITGTEYMLTAAHCFWALPHNGVGAAVLNGYVENNGSIYPSSSATLIGDVGTENNLSAGKTSLDVALIPVSTSTVDFDAPWNSQGRAIQIGPATNAAGDQVCTSGAFDGQVCGLTVQSTDMTKCGDDGWGRFCVSHLAEATSSEPATVAAGKGDSGGPVFSYSRSNILANGMIEQGDGAFANCTSNPPDAPSGRICTDGIDYVEMPHIDSNWGVAPNS